jgi:hypothetical protein
MRQGLCFVNCQGLRDSSEGPVSSDLLKDVPALTSEEPKPILKFFCRYQGDI